MKKILIPILFLLLLASCSKYQKILKSTDLNLKFEKAVAYYEKDDFNSTALGIVVRSNNFFATPYIGRSDGNSDTGIQFGILLPQ